jgi:hypothetical protein
VLQAASIVLLLDKSNALIRSSLECDNFFRFSRPRHPHFRVLRRSSSLTFSRPQKLASRLLVGLRNRRLRAFGARMAPPLFPAVQASAPPGVSPRPFSFEEAVALLISRGLNEEAIRLSSIPERHLQFAGAAIARNCPRRPLRALHVGNFVGVSLAALSGIVIQHDPGSLVVSVDPNLPHLGVHSPQDHVLALLAHFGMQRNNVMICGYSLHRTDNKTKLGTIAASPACEQTLENLERLGHQFDLALIDGNHSADYLSGELAVLVRLLPGGALLILDDVSRSYPHIQDLFREVAASPAWPFEKVAHDGNIGILRRTEDAGGISSG